MAITLGVSNDITDNSGGSTPGITLTGTTAGRSLVVCVRLLNATTTISSITCSGESNLTLDTRAFESGTSRTVQWAYLDVLAAGGTKTITVNLSAGSFHVGIFAQEIIGGKTSDIFDASAQATNAGSTNPTVSLTTGTAGNAILAAVFTNAAAEPDPGSGLAYTRIVLGQTTGFSEAEYILSAGAAGAKTVDFVDASSGAWALSAIALNVDIDTPRTPTVGSLSLNGVAPGIVNPVPITPTVGALNLAGIVPPVLNGPQILTIVGALALAGVAPTVTQSNTNITPTVGLLSLAGVAPSLLNVSGSQPSAAVLALTGAAPGITLGGVATFDALTALGINEPSTRGAGIATFERVSATGEVVSNILSQGVGVFAALSGVGYTPVGGAATFEKLTAAGYSAGAATGAGTFKPLGVVTQAANPVFEKLVASGIGTAALADTYSAKVMNSRNASITEYTNYAFNSFARINGSYYGAGPAGLVRLDGAKDDSVDISWSLRTGQLDDKVPELKRLPEVVAGLRSNGPIRVRVWSSDTEYYDYMLPPVKLATIHQHRVKVGKGMRSRWYAVELQGVSNSTLELDNIQVNFTKTTRRLG